MIARMVLTNLAFCLPAALFVFFLLYLLLRRRLGIPRGKSRVLLMFVGAWVASALLTAVVGLKGLESLLGRQSIFVVPAITSLASLMVGARIGTGLTRDTVGPRG